MNRYYFWLAARSLKGSPWLSGLMVLAIALGIGTFMTSYAIFHAMSGNPIPHKSHQLFNVRLDNWSPEEAFAEPNEPPSQMTYRDARYLAEAGAARHQTAMFRVGMAVQPHNPDIKPLRTFGRMTYSDFFAMFEPPFLHGGPWTRQDDRGRGAVTVISRDLNDRVFGGDNSVGRKLRLDGADYTVVGVLDTFDPLPRYYDVVNNGPFAEGDDFYLPFTLNDRLELRPNGNNSCWSDPAEDSYQGYLDSECVWVALWVQLDSPAQRRDYQAFIDNYVGEQKRLGRFPRPLNNRLDDVMSWLRVQRVVDDDTHIQLGLSFAFLLVCLLNTVGLMLAKFLRRAGEVSVRRALGASRGQIFRQYLTESALLGAAGALLGLGLASLGLAVARRLSPDMDMLTRLDPGLALFALAVSVTAALLAGLYPTWRACAIAPASQLKTQ
ncbi:ABC transporter permease [Parahaliea mediterranea]|uniref:ABC transporter permease n=1 Tax=Parahaliea mediterranea TaxID=651086 RepID=A0A939DDY4_9GAMM|nr:ABC transporter permease [Parahaliea mediterranea]MBN7796490.1 ABC transporter permease [Parahaliea mediterranea]